MLNSSSLPHTKKQDLYIRSTTLSSRKVEYYKEKKQELKEILDLVKEKFPEIKVEIEHECSDKNICLIYANVITTTYRFPSFPDCLVKESYLKQVTIYATDKYFTLPFEEKLSGMAHELEHILRITKVLNPKKIYRYDQWSKQLENMCYVMEHKAKRLKKWVLLKELDADKQAAIRGYGEGTLNFLKRLQPPTENIKIRIKNLEKILGKS